MDFDQLRADFMEILEHVTDKRPGTNIRPKIRIEKPALESSQNIADIEVLKEVHKFAQMIPSELEPNVSRVQEIKEEIRRGTYLTRDKIEEAAARLANRLQKSED